MSTTTVRRRLHNQDLNARTPLMLPERGGRRDTWAGDNGGEGFYRGSARCLWGPPASSLPWNMSWLSAALHSPLWMENCSRSIKQGFLYGKNHIPTRPTLLFLSSGMLGTERDRGKYDLRGVTLNKDAILMKTVYSFLMEQNNASNALNNLEKVDAFL
ncbi:hypothetical protein AVEN_4643-1 [Araneus ventricosus]|uniref:Uncharacterized protein n=1 Tax=Araneus ventricosus TaxID=182803 RepID=A0A4Y2PBB3_ARAVE|nr:hypothetical protein AVEN_4643-1 [Araneus ventricosus]